VADDDAEAALRILEVDDPEAAEAHLGTRSFRWYRASQLRRKLRGAGTLARLLVGLIGNLPQRARRVALEETVTGFPAAFARAFWHLAIAGALIWALAP
jgi:hypothetical protein